MAATTGPVAPFLVEVGILVAALAAVARLASALRMPAVPLYLLVGVAAGSGGLLPLGFSSDFIAAGAQIGVLLLLFMLGLEFSGEDLAATLRSGRAASALDALNALPGLFVGLALGWSLAASFLLAGATYASSSGIVAKLLDELDRVGNRETPIVLGVLVSEDLAMAAILPIAAVLVSGEPLLWAALIASGALIVAGFAVLVAIRYGDRISRLLVHSSDEAVLLSVLGLVLVVGGVAEAANISAAIGAFLVGTALSDPVAQRARQLMRPLRDVFAATFFVFFGLRIDTGVLVTVLGAAVVLWAVSAALKVATGWWAARRAGIGVRGAARAGTALIARGEFSILLAQLGVSAGLEPQLGPLAAAYVLLCAISGPLLARASDALVDALRGRRPLRERRRSTAAD
ncbi:MAG TPA: cation:proton antiporter [Solirubrobacteraceae bacterium]|nr:cation:proton antiporter [Solirubrobacteraceae bacterium]